MNGSLTGVVLLNMGGPDSLSSVKPFLKNLFSDREIIRLGPSFLHNTIASLIIWRRLKKTIHAYSLIGGRSPLTEITQKQAIALENRLNSDGTRGYRVAVGMRYWHPLIADTLLGLKAEGVKDLIGLSLYPQCSRATSGSTIKVFETVAKDIGLPYKTIASWHDNQGYIECLAHTIREGMGAFDQKPFVLFSAHSLPKRFVDEGDPYVRQTEETVQMVVEKLGLDSSGYALAYQSKTGPVKWLEPTTEDTIIRLSREGVKDLLIVPVSFVSDHIETLYEIDMLYKELAGRLGVRLHRSRSFNTDPRFIETLKALTTKLTLSLRTTSTEAGHISV